MDTDRDMRRARSGQAVAELAVGLFAVSLVLAGVFGFLSCIVSALDMRRGMREEAGKAAMGATSAVLDYSSSVRERKVEVSPMAADWIFGSREVKLRDEVHIPAMGISL